MLLWYGDVGYFYRLGCQRFFALERAQVCRRRIKVAGHDRLLLPHQLNERFGVDSHLLRVRPDHPVEVNAVRKGLEPAVFERVDLLPLDFRALGDLFDRQPCSFARLLQLTACVHKESLAESLPKTRA